MRPHLPWFVAAGVAVGFVACSRSHGSPVESADGGDDGGLDMTPTRPAEAPVAPALQGTGGFGFSVGSAFPGAAAPQGLAKLGPDTSGPWGTIQFLHCSGYWYGDDTIQGFSHMHVHGTGVPDYGVLGIMPLPAFDGSQTTMGAYQSKFDKTTESASPGSYAVTLANGGIRVEETATTHAGHHRFTFAPGTTTGHVVLDLDHHIASGTVSTETVDLDPLAGTVTGSFRSLGGLSGGFGGTMVYFVAKPKQLWSAAQVWSAGAAPATGQHAQGTGVGAELDFDLSSNPGPVEVQVGLSLTSTAEAGANLAAEMPSFAFDHEAAATAAAWQQATSVIAVQGGTPVQQAMMQAAVYHLFLMPTVQSDVDGSYVGLDGKIAKASGWHYCSDLSLWDIYRTLHPLYDLVAQDRASDTVQSLVAMARAAGFFPKWPIGDGEAGTMIGASAEVVVADSYVKGVRGFDAEGAYQILSAAAMSSTDPPGGRGGRSSVVPYMQLGYVPATVGSSASLTIEYGQDDWALAQLATALGHTSDAATLQARSHGWQKLFDPATGYLWSKNADGSWATTHGDPTIQSDDFDEANAAQSLWGPWYDVAGLETVLGGKDALVSTLESFFEQGKADYDSVNWTEPLSSGTQRKWYWGGNEPDIHSPYLFALAGHPELTQKWLPWIEGEVYTAGADGLPGNDDAGTMSAWLVFSMVGFYPIPGTDQYVVGAPAFTQSTLAVPGGAFTVSAPAASPANLYVQGVTLNGTPLATPVIHHADLKAGGTLAFEMGPTASTWGQSP
ncbi:MAG TPA: GH92 family glycosyl hydrolase [Polyangiaceae bacterium]|jgi:predicted alpha-1,2-mannosidase